MNQLDLSMHQSAEITVACEQTVDGAALLGFSGSIEHRNPGTFLDPLLADLHAQMVKGRISALTADFSGLKFLNSSGIKSLLMWVMWVRDMPARDRYTMEFVYSNDILWQYASFHSISLLARGAVTITERSSAP
ncbi:MAG: hypothetical protein JWM80_1591 [Cyanobacteria bacterium RYN_339]|nr:hypothetical protein [Cyanobacteria bacterium RYN_339]